MTDLRVRLERLGERAAPRTDAFERLERRRRRKERNRRVGAGALALALVAGGSLAAVTAFRGEGATVGGAETEEGFFALWPEQTRGAAEVAQEQVASGQTDLGWHLDPEGTAAVFAREVLLIEDFTIDGMTAIDTAIDQRPGPVEVEIATPPPPCPSPPEGESISCGPSVFRVTLERLLDRDGIWSITRIESPGLELPMAAGEVVSSGTWIRVPTSLPDGGKVSMGIQFLSACEREGVDDNVVVANGVLELYVPAVPKACIGYVYAALPPTPPGAVATGSFLFSDAPARPSIGYVIRAISAVPVRFVNDTPTAVAVLACDGTGTISPETSAVIAQADGVHIAVTDAGEDPGDVLGGRCGWSRGRSRPTEGEGVAASARRRHGLVRSDLRRRYACRELGEPLHRGSERLLRPGRTRLLQHRRHVPRVRGGLARLPGRPGRGRARAPHRPARG